MVEKRPLGAPKRTSRRTRGEAASRRRPTEAQDRLRFADALARFEPAIAVLARAAVARVRALTPPCFERVYDAYNALSVGFCFSERTGEHFLHVAIYPRHVNVVVPFGTSLTDPDRRLLGGGSRVRHLSVLARSELGDPVLANFIEEAAAQALARATAPPPLRRRLVLRAVYARRRPRRPLR